MRQTENCKEQAETNETQQSGALEESLRTIECGSKQLKTEWDL